MAPEVNSNLNSEVAYRWTGTGYATVVPESNGKYYYTDENGVKKEIPPYILSFSFKSFQEITSYNQMLEDLEARKAADQARYERYEEGKKQCNSIEGGIKNAIAALKKFRDDASENWKKAHEYFTSYFENGSENIYDLTGIQRLEARKYQYEMETYSGQEDSATDDIYAKKFELIGTRADFQGYCLLQLLLCDNINDINNSEGIVRHMMYNGNYHQSV